MKLLIVNEPGRNITAAIRSLAKSPYKIQTSIAYPKKPNFVDKHFSSKYLQKKFFIADPVKNYEQFKKQVLALITKHKYQFILPFGFKTTVALSKFKKEIEKKGVIIPIPDLKTVLKAHDKEQSMQLAEKNGLAIPKTYYHTSLKDLLSKKISYPVIIKARRNSGIREGLSIVNNEEQLIKNYKKIEQNGRLNFIQDFTKPLVQEFIKGDIYDACFFADNDVKSFVFQRRKKSLNNNIGGGTINVTLNNKLKPLAYDYGKKLVKAVGWKGSTQIELIYDKKAKQFKLIEMNPKLWGTLELSIRSGVNFPLNMIRYYYYKEDVRPTPYKSMTFYWFFDMAFSKLKFGSNITIGELIKALFSHNEILLRDWRADARNVLVAFIKK